MDLFELEIPDDVTRCGRRHEEEEIVGYAVVLTGFAGVKVRDVGYYDEFSRREAYEELERQQYEAARSAGTASVMRGIVDRKFVVSARIDVLYRDGCRSREWTP